MPTTSAPPFHFRGTNPHAQRVAARQAARFVTAISAETRLAIRALITRSIREGIPVVDAARMIRSLVGLTTPQAQAAANYRAAQIDQGHTLERVNRLTDRYAAKKIRDRAMAIARTETMSALNTGALESFREAKADGLLGDNPTKVWIITPDERLCELCAPMDGVTVPLNEPFQTAIGAVDGPPLHVQCRCAVSALA